MEWLHKICNKITNKLRKIMCAFKHLTDALEFKKQNKQTCSVGWVPSLSS